MNGVEEVLDLNINRLMAHLENTAYTNPVTVSSPACHRTVGEIPGVEFLSTRLDRLWDGHQHASATPENAQTWHRKYRCALPVL